MTSAAVRTLSVHVPMAIRRRGGRKVIIAPDGTTTRLQTVPAHTGADPTLVKALARAFRWKRMLETGRYASISDIGIAEKIDRGYVGSILRLTLLAPDIVEAVLDGRHPPDLALPRLLQPLPLGWDEQRLALFTIGDMGASAAQGLHTARAASPMRTQAASASPSNNRSSRNAHRGF